MSAKNQPLNVEIKDGAISISIGVETLAKVVELKGGSLACKITNPAKFAIDVLVELTAEQEDGTTEVHLLLDQAAQQAIENGSDWAQDKEL
jgi:hypothetical protein